MEGSAFDRFSRAVGASSRRRSVVAALIAALATQAAGAAGFARGGGKRRVRLLPGPSAEGRRAGRVDAVKGKDKACKGQLAACQESLDQLEATARCSFNAGNVFGTIAAVCQLAAPEPIQPCLDAAAQCAEAAANCASDAENQACVDDAIDQLFPA